MNTKQCRICGEVKALSKFGIRRQAKNGRATRCKKCAADSMRKYNTKHRDKRRKQTIKVYGLSRDEYNTMLSDQKGKCICGRDNDGKNLDIDHDHKTGDVRGLLCRRCNMAIGLLGDDASLILKAFQYIAKWTSRVSD